MQLYDIHISCLPWMEAILIGVLLIVCVVQPRTIVMSILAIISPIQRRYTIGKNQSAVMGLRSLFELGTIALTLLVATTAHEGYAAELNWKQIQWAVGLLIGISICKWLIEQWMQFVFRFSLSDKTYYGYRNDLLLIVGLVLWLTMLISPWLSATFKWVIPCIVIILYTGTLWWRIMQAFGWNIEHIVLSLLYILHVEILPLLAVVIGINTFVITKDIYLS